MADYAPPPDFFKPFIEPPSAANTANPPIFPYNQATITRSGHQFELDDTPERERVRLQHRTGTFIEMHPNGDEVHKVYGDGYEITVKDKKVYVTGNCQIYVDGDAYLQVAGDKIEQIQGNYECHVKGNYSMVVENQITMTSSGDTTINAGTTPLSGFRVGGGYGYFDCDLSTSSEFIATKITSLGRVDAVLGMSAGVNGFVTELGGIAVGIPAAVPLSINASGPINSLTSISAPLGLFGVSSSVLGFDVINSLIFDTHVHPTPAGVSGPTPTPETQA